MTVTKWRDRVVEVPSKPLKSHDKPPKYPLGKIQFEACLSGWLCLNADSMRAFILWRDPALVWMSNADLQCREQGEEHDVEDLESH